MGGVNVFSLKPSTSGTSFSAITPSPKQKKQKQKTYGKSPRPFIRKLYAEVPETLPVPTTNGGEEKPKSNRQLKAERKAEEWRKRIEERRLNDTIFVGQKPKPKPQNEDIDFLSELNFLRERKKREREREAFGSGVPTANEKKKRKKTEVKGKGKAGNEFPLLNGTSVPRILTPATAAPKTATTPSKTTTPAETKPAEEHKAHGAQLKAQAFALRKQREQLPIWKHQESLRQCLRDRDVLVMLGQTGSGKSTQIGQFFLNEPWMQRRLERVGKKTKMAIGGCIAITQPRRVAAINLARRVAAEMGVRLGEESNSNTRIKFLTDGMLLQEMLADPLLKKYSVVVVDEAHERTVGTDLVMGFLRGLIYGERRGTLKAVVMSATLEVEAMAKFFEEKRGEGLLPPPEEVIEDKLELDDHQDTIEVKELGGSGIPEVKDETAHGKKSKKRKKKKKKGQYNPEDLIRSPSPIPQRIPTPVAEDEAIGAIVNTDEGTGVIPYFGTVALFHVPGRQYPVEVHHTAEPVPDFLEAALKTVFQIHYKEPCPGDILVFLTGQEEIVTLQKSIEEYAAEMDKNVPKILVLPLYAALPLHQQNRVFEPTPYKTRKIILSTNIAETSVTVTGVRHVIDCGKAKLKQFRPKLGLESLLITPISKSSALQRAGRAGREAPGKCYCLYTQEDFNALRESTKPEILRTDVASAILTLKARGQEDVVNFDYLSPPKTESLHKALEQLYSLGAFDNSGKITSLGRDMAKFPLSPPLARVLLAAAEPDLDCLPEVVDVIAALSSENLFPMILNDDVRDAREETHKAFHRSEGDHIMLLEVVRAYEAHTSSAISDRKHWCETNFVSHRAMNMLFEIRKQLRQYCASLRGVTGATWEVGKGEPISPDLAERVLKAFLKGYFHQTARAAPDGGYLTVLSHQNVTIHPASILFGRRKEALVYHEYVFTTKPFARWCSAVQLDWVADASPVYLKGAV
ncbi:P-loop containing nucleoside triphosphate hydrolase protein [Trichophaea hybrida]|nr:P-loop containing nucleoside triphosphate hydrolase protein [Trichophaea hybrida]